jgi:hypothetical protein
VAAFGDGDKVSKVLQVQKTTPMVPVSIIVFVYRHHSSDLSISRALDSYTGPLAEY